MPQLILFRSDCRGFTCSFVLSVRIVRPDRRPDLEHAGNLKNRLMSSRWLIAFAKSRSTSDSISTQP